MEELEEFVRKNRNDFDGQRPRKEKMWAHIEQQLPEQGEVKRPNNSTRIWFLTIIVLLFAAVGGVLFIQSKKPAIMMVQQEELHDINSYYTQLISYKVEQVKTSMELSEEDKEEFLEYFQELENECKKLETDLTQQLDNEQVLGAIVENYRQRLNLLENLLRRLNNTKVKSDEKSILL